MREILFRGKCVDTGVWYEGGYIHLHKTTHCPIGDPERFPDNDIHQIVFERMTDWELPNQHLRVDVNPETVGQFTGLTDKNGKKIFEGDVLPIEDEIVAVVIFKDGCFRMEEYGLCGAWTESGFDECGGGWGIIECEPIDWYTVGDMEIIGNIHDNPELIGGKENA